MRVAAAFVFAHTLSFPEGGTSFSMTSAPHLGHSISILSTLLGTKRPMPKVAELSKADKALARYMGWHQKQKEASIVRGFLVASDFPEGVQYAAQAVPNLSLRRYHIRLEFEDAGLEG